MGRIKHLAILSVHTSPLAALGGKKTGGMNVYVRELAKAIAHHGLAVDIFTRRESLDQPEIDYSLGQGVRVVHVYAGAPIPLDPTDVYPHVQQFSAGVIAFATKQNVIYDFVYANYWLSGWVGHKLKEVWGTPFAQMFHTLGHMKNRIDTSYNGMSLPDVRIRVETQIVGWADRLIAATPAEQTQLLWLYRADPRKIAIVPPGVDSERFHPVDRLEARATLGIGSDEPFLLFVGRIEPLKAVDSILEAICLLRMRDPQSLIKARVAIIGGNAGNPELERLIALSHQMGLNDLVQFLGAKSQTELPIYYAAATAVIMPSDYESFGMVALEAMASGTPVIATEVGGLAYLVRDNQTGYLVPVREPEVLSQRIQTLLTDPITQARLGHNAAEYARSYAWDHIAEQLIGVFEGYFTGRKQNRRTE
ncbi:MAG: glycosyltransferase [Anaerolineae bacterium]|nr:glycosyltransferase [Anaerolineae bacterium]